ncbi:MULTISPECIES: CsbD family protein [Sphingomonas]|jgi:uncharacterized protein YjbJ (UPF0337 family)|uniref:CsbD family protein n=1 Tax=Sphingomonas glacialis TaxID=658225 RepID=A0ABQ3LKJ5_9SPHN|nr:MULTISPECIES: CsbD family protein [Sphingomonas]MDY7525078.1 CsbD family protein [Sphingomonas sp. 10B4]MEB0283387.1 CsbD family protein [Sphingomonas sp. 10B4]GHH10998.1 hypothetical protein GCM10008023_09480 [Sphingomonas glacialis]
MTQRRDKGRARQAKGSVQEAIGKIIGDADVERQGRRESEAGADQARGESPMIKDGDD